jgi:hypothetical protein
LSLGARYDYNGIKYGDGKVPNGQAELQASRWAALIRVGTSGGGGFVGLVGTYGLAHRTQLTLKSPAGTIRDYTSTDGTSFSVGIELGLALGPIRFGTEGGYQYYWIDEFKSATASSIKADLRGGYVKGLIGFAL